MRTYYQITAELYQEHVVPVINGKQYDTGRSVLITLTDAGAVVVPEASDTLRLYCKKPDGTVSYLPATLTGTAVSVDLTNQVQAVAGVVECELQIGTGADMVSTPVFRLLVLPSNIDAAAVESSNEFGALETALATVQQYDSRIQRTEDAVDALGEAATYGVANNLTTASAGEKVLDAYQGKQLAEALDELGTFTTVSRTATTTSIGNISLALSSSNVAVLAAWVLGAYMCVPFTDTNGVWYVKVLSWNGSTYSVAASVSVTVNYLYKTV